MTHVRKYQLGKNSALSQRILNEIAAARVCLLDSAKKAAHDERLRQELQARIEQASGSEAAYLDPGTAGLVEKLERDDSPSAAPASRRNRKPSQPC